MTEIFNLFTADLATAVGVDATVAETITTWLKGEGFVDIEQLVETYGPVAKAYAENDNTAALASVA